MFYGDLAYVRGGFAFLGAKPMHFAHASCSEIVAEIGAVSGGHKRLVQTHHLVDFGSGTFVLIFGSGAGATKPRANEGRIFLAVAMYKTHRMMV